MQDAPPPVPSASEDPLAALSPLDRTIFRFWEEYARRQLRADKRDVALMLERALSFFFERSMDGGDPDAQTRRGITVLRQALGDEITRARTWVDGAQGNKMRRQAFEPRALSFDPNNAAKPVVVTPRAPTTAMQDVQAFIGALQQQMTAADELLAILTDRLVRSRAQVSERLKALSPLLYEHGMRLVAAHDAHSAAVVVADAALVQQVVASDTRAPALALLERVKAWRMPSLERLQTPTARRAAAQEFFDRVRRLLLRLWQQASYVALSYLPLRKAAAPVATSRLDARVASYEALAADWARSADKAASAVQTGEISTPRTRIP